MHQLAATWLAPESLRGMLSSSMNTRWTNAVVLLLSSAGCGGIAVIDVDGSGGGGTTSASNTVAVSSTGSSSGTGGGGGELIVTLVSAVAFANCQPEVLPDPIDVDLQIRFDNVGSGSATAFLPNGVLISAGLTFSFDLDPGMAGPIAAGDSDVLGFSKVPGSGSSSGGSACDLCTATDTQLQIAVAHGDSQTLVDELIDSFSCVF
jgi:hypothetical protein